MVRVGPTKKVTFEWRPKETKRANPYRLPEEEHFRKWKTPMQNSLILEHAIVEENPGASIMGMTS